MRAENSCRKNAVNMKTDSTYLVMYKLKRIKFEAHDEEMLSRREGNKNKLGNKQTILEKVVIGIVNGGGEVSMFNELFISKSNKISKGLSFKGLILESIRLRMSQMIRIRNITNETF